MQADGDSAAPLGDEVVVRAKKGDAIARTRLLYHVENIIENWAKKKLPEEAVVSADDIAQETSKLVVQQFSSLNADTVGGVVKWALTIAENVLYTHHRKGNTKKRGSDVNKVPVDKENPNHLGIKDKSPSPERTAANNEAIAAVKCNVDALPTTQRLAIQLHHLQAKTLKETAKHLGKTIPKLRTILDHAKRTMKKGLGGSSKWFSK